MYYVGARYYDSNTGRFLSQDPALILGDNGELPLRTSQNLNKYAYSLNNPYRYVDLNGRESSSIWKEWEFDIDTSFNYDYNTGVTFGTFNLLADIVNDSPSDLQSWYYVFGTREGLVGKTTATGHIIQENDVFVALPSRTVLNMQVELFYKGNSLVAPILDVGPWNTKDPYWLTNSRPQAESGIDMFERKTNSAGIDLSNEAFRKLGLKNNDWIYWRFIIK